MLKSTYFFAIIIILNISLQSRLVTFAQQEQTKQQIQKQQIYGIRWYLGDYFAFHMPLTQPLNKEMFLLYFNSVQQLDDQVYLKINGTRYGCYQRFLEINSVGQHHKEHNKNASQQGTNFTNAMYKCIVYQQRFNNLYEIPYQIISAWTDFQGEKNAASIKNFKQDILFEGKLRLPQNIQNLNFLFLADWGEIQPETQKQKGYKQVLPSLIKTLNQNQNIGLLLFGGDLAYDYEGASYISILKYLQPLTSCIPFLVTPGNHESIYHQDSFQLFVESNYDPMWTRYFNYFSLVKFQNQKTVILSYDPQHYIFPEVNRFGKNLTQIFETQLNKTVTAYIKQNYDVFVFSHYPIYCSQDNEHYQTCQKNKIIFKPFRNKFQQMGMDVYLSGHLHIYQRTKQICDDNNFTHNDKNQYNKSCPIYVVDGSAGNNDYVAMQKTYDVKNYSEVIGYGTGYGLVAIQNRNITYTHIKINDKQNVTVFDSFKLYQSVKKSNKTNSKEENDQLFHRMSQRAILIVQIVALGAVAGLSAYLICKLRTKKKPNLPSINTQQHVQMIQEIMDSGNQNQSRKNGQVAMD